MKHSLSKLQISHQSVSQVSGIAVILILIAFPLILNQYKLSILTEVLIFGLLAMSLDILIGYTGLVSFNHATFFGVAAYTVGIFFQKGFQNFWFTLPAGIIASLLLAMLLGLLVLRSSGPYFLMITLAFGQLIFAVAWKWRSLTGGDDGLAGISRPEMGLPLSSEEGFYYLVLIFFLSSYFF